MCATAYTDDTQAITMPPAAAPMVEAHAVRDGTKVWMANNGRSGNTAKSTLWLLREPLGGVAILLSRGFKRLGVGQRLAAVTCTGPVVCGRLVKGPVIRRRMECSLDKRRKLYATYVPMIDFVSAGHF